MGDLDPFCGRECSAQRCDYPCIGGVVIAKDLHVTEVAFDIGGHPWAERGLQFFEHIAVSVTERRLICDADMLECEDQDGRLVDGEMERR